MSRYFNKSLFASLALLVVGCAQAVPQPLAVEPSQENIAPSRAYMRTFEQLGRVSDSLLLGIHNSDQIEFTLRSDHIASDAKLQLEYTPSPALLPVQSHIRVYLNDALMNVMPIEQDQLGRKTIQQVVLDPRLVTDFNRIRLEFIGHYTDTCEDPANSALWVSVSRASQVSLQEQTLLIKNDLAFFPRPFFDVLAYEKPVINMVFAASPTLGAQKAAGILASYFGSLAGWRGSQFPVLFDQLPAHPEKGVAQPSVVFATNDHRPEFLADLEQFPRVDAPVVQLIDNPNDRFSKVLLIMGRNDEDLAVAARALALGGDLFRGSRVIVDGVQQIQPRQPYDAPNWMRTDRPVRFAELIKYPEQLQVSGLQPRSIILDVKLPPDLFVWRNQGIPLQTKYRYTPPSANDDSRLNISLNNQFITSLPLLKNTNSRLEELRLAVLSNETANVSDKLLVPALKIGDHNSIRFDFSFASTFGSSQRDRCQTSLPVDTRALIDEESTIDLSGYYHYIAMPDLKAFARSGFPFSRMADLSETLVVVPNQPTAAQLSTALEVLAKIASQTGFPALALNLSDKWEDARNTNADLLVLGALAPEVKEQPDLNVWLNDTRASLIHASNATSGQASARAGQINDERNLGANRVEVTATGPIAAIVGMQSPFHEQRSIVALLADTPAGYQILRETIGDNGKMGAVSGSVAMIRASGVSSQQVGEQYFVGYLPWWLMLWFQLSEHPVLLAGMAALGVLLAAFLLWCALRWAARRRFAHEE